MADPPPTPSRRQAQSTIVLDGLQFETDSDQLVEGSEAVLENVITSLKNHPDIRLEIAGYTDDRGDALYNRILSRRRAEAVMIYLVEHGIDARRLTAAGYGSDDPIADNATEAGRRQNRRVELHIR
jgi:outer membrane protein OmpA-like peptidoglycan-associated protein